MLDHTDVQFEEVLTKEAIALLEDRNDFAVVNGAIPLIFTDKINGTYKKYSADDMRRRSIAERAGGEEFAKFQMALEDLAFHCKQQGSEFRLDDRDQVEGALEDMGKKMVEDAFANYDIKLANLMVAGKFGTDIQGDNTATTGKVLKWTNANSDPVADIEDAKDKISAKLGVEPDTLIITRDVFKALKKNANIKGLLRDTTDRIVTLDKLAELFDLRNVYVLNATATTTNRGQADQKIERVASGKALLYYRGTAEGALIPSTVKAFAYDGKIGRATKGIGLQTYRMEVITADIIRVVQDFEVVIEIKDGGALFYDIV